MQKLRIALLINDYVQPAWAAEMIERLQTSEACEVVGFVLPANPQPRLSPFKKLSSNGRYLLYKLYAVIDRMAFQRGEKDPFIRRDVRQGDAPEIRLPVRRTMFRDFVEKQDLGELEKLKPDVLVRLGFRILSGPILTLARYGMWSYHHGDNRVNRGGPAGLWEVINREPTTGLTLQILSEDLDAGKVLYRGLSKTYPWSWHGNKCHYYWKSVFILPREIERLAQMGEDKFWASKRALNPELDFYSHPLYRKPQNARMLRFLISHSARLVGKAIYDLFCEEYWKIGVLDLSKSLELRKAQFLTPPRNTIWADPFYCREEVSGKDYIFFEKQYKNRNGVIEYFVRKAGNLHFEGPYPALAEEHHLSFPNVFSHQGVFFMMPEAEVSNRLVLYQAQEFPLRWEHRKTLLKGRFVDPILFYREGLYWLFVNKGEHRYAPAADELHIYYTQDANFGQWKSHPMNPVVTDVRFSRNAGNIIAMANGELYRVSQKINKRYGEAVQCNRIDILTPEDYRETCAGLVSPDFDYNGLGLHTLQRNGNTLTFDVASWRWRS